MAKKIVTLLMIAVMLLSMVPTALMESEPGYMTDEQIMGIDPKDWPKTMYVSTKNKGKLNVRSEPKSGKNVIGQLDYGTKVTVLSPVIINADWSVIKFSKGKDGVGYVMTRYLVKSKPKDADQQADKRAKEEERKRNLEELNKQLKSARSLAAPLVLRVQASRTSGWVNFRVGPGVAADRIYSLADGTELTAIEETNKWYKAIDPATGKTGYVSKNYVAVMGEVIQEPAAPVKEQMGSLNVNGEFSLQCKLPEGYTMQLINTLGSRITAFISSADTEKPTLQLTIAFDEMYANVDRMKDLPAEALATLEESFTEMNDVEISYKETAYGTKLLVAKEVGDDADFVDILSVYKGYSIEFLMTPNPSAKNQTLTDAQTQMCIDFLSELDFVPAA